MKTIRTVTIAGASRDIALFLASLHLALFAGFIFAVVSAAQAVSAETACHGKDLVAGLEAERPAEVAAVRAEAAGIPFGKGLLWEVVSPEGGVSHVFGTMHSPDPRIVALSSTVERDLAAASAILVESTDALDPAPMAAQMAKLRPLIMLEGTTLDELLPPEAVAVVQKETAERGLPWAAARQMQPWMIAAAIGRSRCDMAAAGQGGEVLDAIIARRAGEDGKRLVGLETVAEQFDAVAGIPQGLHVNALADLAAMAGSSEDMMETTKRLYLAGETGLLLPLMRLLSPKAYEGEGYADFQHRLIAKRNQTMVERAMPELEKGGAFMAVGALHLPGADGILKLLEKRGYTIRQISS